MRIAVTWASGFLGARAALALRSRGHDVVPFGRRVPGDLTLGLPGYRVWDLVGDDDPDVRVDAVVHCAGCVSDWASDVQCRAINVGGTRAVLRVFRHAARFVHVSTASVYDPAVAHQQQQEMATYPARYASAYARSKMEAERCVLDDGRAAIVLRPHVIYGPGDTHILPRLIASRRLGCVPLIGPGDALISVTHVDNLVHAIVLALEGRVSGGIFNVADALVGTVEEVALTLLRRSGFPARPIHVPVGVARVSATCAEWLARFVRSAEPPVLTRFVVEQMAREFTLDLRRAVTELGYAPRWTFRDGPLAV